MVDRLRASGECGHERPRVLIVSAEFAETIQDAVHSSGYIVAGVANDAQTALDSIAYSAVDAVLLNSRRLPEWLDLVACLREQGIPIALLSAAHELADRSSYLH
jgi:DNA-binding response OmpR family regulator